MASEALKRVAFGLTKTVVCEPLKESIDRSSLDMIAWPINKALRDFCDCSEFSGFVTLDGIRRIAAEGREVEHEAPRRRSVAPRSAMLLPVRGERRTAREHILDALRRVCVLTHQRPLIRLTPALRGAGQQAKRRWPASPAARC